MVTSALVRAPELQNAEIVVHFSRQRIEVNSASSKRASDNDLKFLDNLQENNRRIFDCFLRTLPI
jgi:hypothetical protein